MKTGTIEQLRQDMNNGVYNFTNNGKCSNCGNCCSNLLPMTDKEFDRIKKYVKKHNIKDQALKVVASGTMNFDCPFRDEGEKKCVIYEVRPAICRAFKCDSTNHYTKEMFDLYKQNPVVVMVREEIYGIKR